jgi:hypothetical protein
MLMQRIALAVLTVQGLLLGCWAAFAPRSFYDDFPGFGHHWVAVDGPYNEHLVRDVGSLFLALFVLTCAVLAAPTARLVRITGGSWLAFAVPHLLYHYRHLDLFDPLDRWLNVVVLAVSVLLPAYLLLAPTPRCRKPARGGS